MNDEVGLALPGDFPPIFVEAIGLDEKSTAPRLQDGNKRLLLFWIFKVVNESDESAHYATTFDLSCIEKKKFGFGLGPALIWSSAKQHLVKLKHSL